MPSPFSPARPLRLAIVNDYEVVVRGLAAMLEPHGDRVKIVELNANLPVSERVDIALYDTFSVPQVTDEDVEKLIRNEYVDQVAVFTWNMHPDLIDAARAKGVRGYLSKSLGTDALIEALERIARGETVVEPAGDVRADVSAVEADGGDWPGREAGLSVRQSEVVALITQGLSNEEIAERSYLTLNTVKSYIRVAYRRMGVSTRAQAVIWGYEHGMGPDRARITRDQ